MVSRAASQLEEETQTEEEATEEEETEEEETEEEGRDSGQKLDAETGQLKSRPVVDDDYQ